MLVSCRGGAGGLPGLGLGNWSQHGSRDWVSALGFSCIKLFLLWRLIADEEAQVTLLVLWAAVDQSDNSGQPERTLFPLETCGTWQARKLAPDVNPLGAGLPIGTPELCQN